MGYVALGYWDCDSRTHGRYVNLTLALSISRNTYFLPRYLLLVLYDCL